MNVNMTFVKCIDEIMYCLSDHDLQALQVIYSTRIKEATKYKEADQVPQQHATLATAEYFMIQLFGAITLEQRSRKQQREKKD